ncbi:MAG: oxygen-independent coproporphyrinogen III oxidase [Clostridia bacterium]|nr:oxygen-independent coproporphyrinogen III oxidase [Clostridia bacterium]
MFSNLTRDLALYIHIPFCAAKCIYCDFLSFSGRESYFDAYFNQLNNEIRNNGALYGDAAVRSVFIGGGTPSYAGAKRIAEMIDNIFRHFNVASDAEFTVEMNPGTVSESDFHIYKAAGVNRISFGVQSLDNNLLRFLGRIHTREDFLSAFENARRVGFNNINTDIIFGIPGQTVSQFKDTLNEIISLSPEHISAYSLIIEPETRLDYLIEKGEVEDPSDEDDREMYTVCRKMLAQSGYNMYEISNFAKPGCECIHNIRYWVCGNYLGMGLGAASLIDGRRFSNTNDFHAYTDGVNEISEDIILTKKERMDEFMMLGFRMMTGPSKNGFKSLFGRDYKDVYRDVLSDLSEKELISENPGINYCLTEKGLDFANEVFREFV